jgi:hypothetical protein
MPERTVGTHMQHARLIETEIRRVESKLRLAIFAAILHRNPLNAQTNADPNVSTKIGGRTAATAAKLNGCLSQVVKRYSIRFGGIKLWLGLFFYKLKVQTGPNYVIGITVMESARRGSAKIDGQCPPRRCGHTTNPQHRQDQPQSK